MQALFNYQKQQESGTKNPIVARFTAQTANLLQNCRADTKLSQAIITLYAGPMLKRILRCWEIEQGIRANIEKAKASYKPAAGAAQEIPHVPRLKEDCENLLYEFKNFLRELLDVFNLLYGTDYDEASEWIWKSKKHPQPVIEYAVGHFGADNIKTRFLQQMKPCNGPFITMRNAVEHPDGYSGRLVISDFTIGADGQLNEPVWFRVKDSKVEYGPTPIQADIGRAVHNLFVSGEDIFVMWAMENLLLLGIVTVGVAPEADRNPDCPIKYRLAEGPHSPARPAGR
jgi:hypothetical protein